MIFISEKIEIKADLNKIWSFMIDFKTSLSYNRFHKSIELPIDYSLGNLGKFKIIHNFGLNDYEMLAEVVDFKPLSKLSLKEYPSDINKNGFSHEIEFEISSLITHSLLNYNISGTYGRKIQDISFKPILKGVIIEELFKIKNAIESSVEIPKVIDRKTIKPI